jgi:hypothetical protein
MPVGVVSEVKCTSMEIGAQIQEEQLRVRAVEFKLLIVCAI